MALDGDTLEGFHQVREEGIGDVRDDQTQDVTFPGAEVRAWVLG